MDKRKKLSKNTERFSAMPQLAISRSVMAWRASLSHRGMTPGSKGQHHGAALQPKKIPIMLGAMSPRFAFS